MIHILRIKMRRSILCDDYIKMLGLDILYSRYVSLQRESDENQKRIVHETHSVILHAVRGITYFDSINVNKGPAS